MKKNETNTHQCNTKLTISEWNQIQEVNAKYFGNLNTSDLGKVLFKIALDALKEAKVETKTVSVLRVNGKVIDV